MNAHELMQRPIARWVNHRNGDRLRYYRCGTVCLFMGNGACHVDSKGYRDMIDVEAFARDNNFEREVAE